MYKRTYLPPPISTAIQITSFSGCGPCTTAVPCNSNVLLLSTLGHYFPKATGLHYFSGELLVSLDRSSSYRFIKGGLEVGGQAFLLPVGRMFMNYVVTEDKDMVEMEVTGGVIGAPVIEVMITHVKTVQDDLRIKVEELERISKRMKVIKRQKKKNPDGQDLIIELDDAADDKLCDEHEHEPKMDVESMITHDRDIIDKSLNSKDLKDDWTDILESLVINTVKMDLGFRMKMMKKIVSENFMSSKHVSVDDQCVLLNVKDSSKKDIAVVTYGQYNVRHFRITC